ncbi:unnamed protein product, partial [Trypanosoma congolense IL3000]
MSASPAVSPSLVQRGVERPMSGASMFFPRECEACLSRSQMSASPAVSPSLVQRGVERPMSGVSMTTRGECEACLSRSQVSASPAVSPSLVQRGVERPMSGASMTTSGEREACLSRSQVSASPAVSPSLVQRGVERPMSGVSVVLPEECEACLSRSQMSASPAVSPSLVQRGVERPMSGVSVVLPEECEACLSRSQMSASPAVSPSLVQRGVERPMSDVSVVSGGSDAVCSRLKGIGLSRSGSSVCASSRVLGECGKIDCAVFDSCGVGECTGGKCDKCCDVGVTKSSVDGLRFLEYSLCSAVGSGYFDSFLLDERSDWYWPARKVVKRGSVRDDVVCFNASLREGTNNKCFASSVPPVVNDCGVEDASVCSGVGGCSGVRLPKVNSGDVSATVSFFERRDVLPSCDAPFGDNGDPKERFFETPKGALLEPSARFLSR